jgi:hypothetical protein
MKADVKFWRFLRGWLSIWPALSLAWIMGVCIAETHVLSRLLYVIPWSITHPELADSFGGSGIDRDMEEFVNWAFGPPLAAFIAVIVVGLLVFEVVFLFPVWYSEAKNDLKSALAGIRVAARWAKAKLNKG